MSTFKRMFPLVAKYMTDGGNPDPGRIARANLNELGRKNATSLGCSHAAGRVGCAAWLLIVLTDRSVESNLFRVERAGNIILGMPLDTKKIESLRKALGLTQEQAATKARLSGKSYWADIVSGRKANVTMGTLDDIAKALGVNSKELVR